MQAGLGQVCNRDSEGDEHRDTPQGGGTMHVATAGIRSTYAHVTNLVWRMVIMEQGMQDSEHTVGRTSAQ